MIGKKELVMFISEKIDVTKKDAETLFDVVIESIIEGIKEDAQGVLVSGLGKFVIVKKEARKGRNPKTGETVDIPARGTLRFKVAKGLKEEVK